MTAVNDHQDALDSARAAEDEDFWADLMPLAAELVIVAGHATPRMLQRKMRVSWTLAAELLFELHEAGVVGPSGEDGQRQVLVEPGGLAGVLAKLAKLAGEDPPPEVVDLDEVVAPVSLVKQSRQPVELDDPPDQAGGELVLRPDDDLATYEPANPPPRRVVPAVVRFRQASARGTVWVADQPAVSRSLAVGRQLPTAGRRLAAASPRGAARVGGKLKNWLAGADSASLMAKHSEAGEGDQYAKVAHSRTEQHLGARRWWTVGVAAVVAMYCSALWAPRVFAGVLAGLVFAGLAMVTPRRQLQEFLTGLVFAGLVGALVWNYGPALAGLVPRTPSWPWWVWSSAGGVAVVVLGWLGRQDDKPLMPVGQAYKPPPITAPMIVEALFRIGIPGMTPTAADKGMRDEVRILAPGVARSPAGFHVEFELPPGITAGDVGDKREELAGALRRPLGCVWPSGGGLHPGHNRIFIGHKPMATAPQTPWPLAEGYRIDLFQPFPLFTDEEGNWINVTLLGTHAVVAGASGFGKSVTLRQLACACALDPRAQLHIFDGKISGDLAPLQKIAHGYYEGVDDDDIAAQVAALQGIEREMRRRAKFLRDLPPEERSPKVTSALADRYRHLAPIVLLIDECQELTEYGVKGSKDDKAIRDAFLASLTRISRLGRSAGIAMVLVSQKPDANVIPTAIMGNCAIRICHKVTEQNHNDQVLGTSAYKNGYNAALFSQEDRGLAWLRAEGDPRVVRSWSAMVDLEPAVELVDKAYAMRKALGRLTGQAADDGVLEAEVVYNIVADAEQVMRDRGRGKAQWGELVPWLQELRAQYAGLTEEELSVSIRSADIRVRDVRSSGGVRKGVYISDLRECGDDDDA